MRLIDQNEQQLGVVDTFEALRMARDAGLDLVEVAPTARPPVCRIMDYGKWKYDQKKKQHKKQQPEQLIKEVRLRPKTDDHDRQIKINRAIRFFAKGNKVQFTMQFRGRERFNREIPLEIFDGILKMFGEKVKVERRPSMEGRVMIMILAPVKGAFADVTVEDLEEDDQNHEETQDTASDAEGDGGEDDAADRAAGA